ncbi:MAG: tRNA-dihydrouridine synthase [Deltaproteobacteria bacterium]|nr:tRNA-dihydrouridine synthase [Deltaproteobacteria bacterium]
MGPGPADADAIVPGPRRATPLRVGALVVDPPVLLAPMAEVTDLAFRTICEEFGAGLTVTEFLSAHALCAGAEKTRRKLRPSAGGRPYGVQLFGREAAPLVRAALLAADSGAALVDLNMGCPARKVVWDGKGQPDATCRGSGAALMLDPDLAVRLVAAVRAALPAAIPLSVKLRSGWDERRKNAPELAPRLGAAGAALVTVHGRTRAQGFGGEVDLETIRQVRAAVPAGIPVCGNGDVVDVESFERMRTATGCDAVMIGRGAIGNPWVFAAIRAHLRGQPPPAPPDRREKLRVLMRHLALCREHEPANVVWEARKLVCRYARGEPGAARLRARAMSMEAIEALTDLACEFFAGNPKPRAD